MVLAHAGHWVTSLLYLAPVAVVVLFLQVDGRRSSPRSRPDEASDPSLDDVMDGRR